MPTRNKSTKKAAAGAKKAVEKAHAATGRPVSPTEDPTDHSVPAPEIAKQLDPKGTSGAAINAASIDKVRKADEQAAEEQQAEVDNSIAGKIARSGLYFVRDHSRGGDAYIGISPSQDEKADYASKTRSLVEPLDLHSPRTGMQVILKDGTSFTLGDEFGMDSTPADWAKVKSPDGKLLFE